MLCHKCGAYFADEAAPVPVFCHKCDDHHYDRAYALGVYEKALAAIIIDLKTNPVLPGKLREKVGNFINRSEVINFDLIVPVPLSVRRYKERGFNQAEVIARALDRFSGIRLDTGSLARKVHTPMHRGGMDQKARELTVKKSFDVVRPRLITGKKIILVDDVFTSGSTASSCAKVLKKSGAVRVDVFTLARAVMR